MAIIRAGTPPRTMDEKLRPLMTFISARQQRQHEKDLARTASGETRALLDIQRQNADTTAARQRSTEALQTAGAKKLQLEANLLEITTPKNDMERQLFMFKDYHASRGVAKNSVYNQSKGILDAGRDVMGDEATDQAMAIMKEVMQYNAGQLGAAAAGENFLSQNPKLRDTANIRQFVEDTRKTLGTAEPWQEGDEKRRVNYANRLLALAQREDGLSPGGHDLFDVIKTRQDIPEDATLEKTMIGRKKLTKLTNVELAKLLRDPKNQAIFDDPSKWLNVSLSLLQRGMGDMIPEAPANFPGMEQTQGIMMTSPTGETALIAPDEIETARANGWK